MARRSLKRHPSKTLSDDLIYEIMLLLPVKSLIRFKAVSKQWCYTISNPSFIEPHLSIQSRRDDLTLIVHKNETPEDLQCISIIHFGSRKLVDDVLKFPYYESEVSFVPKIRIVGCVRGIVCFSVYTGPHKYRPCNYNYLWNPATKQSKLIPRHTIQDNDNKGVTYGFGFDPAENDFKVVRVVHSFFAAEVYSAKMNVWQTVGLMPVMKDNPRPGHSSICVRGFLCWIGIEGIIAYDLNKDVLHCGIKFPGHGTFYLSRITDLYDSIAMIFSNWEMYLSNIKLWTMDDVECLRVGGVEASWTLMLNVDIDLPIESTCGYFTSGDLLLMTNGFNWVSFNSDHKNDAKKVPTHWCNILKYTESLVSIPGSQQIELNAHADDN